MAGRVAIIAGSDLFSGAAVLAATGALRGGAGLISLHVPLNTASVVSCKCPPEIIVHCFSSMRELRNLAADALVIGCGLGELDETSGEQLLEIMATSPTPAVIDADALNLIAKTGRCDVLQEHHVVTPHPGEFKRLAPDLAEQSREAASRAFADRTSSTLLLKGSRTLITRAGAPLWCNSTGTPGMATGGQGDLLSGVIGARLAAGDSPLEAAALAAWLCGRSAEIALNDRRISEESLAAGDVAMHLGGAYLDWKRSRR
jgi:NAD(P)H-hydrate epimerase